MKKDPFTCLLNGLGLIQGISDLNYKESVDTISFEAMLDKAIKTNAQKFQIFESDDSINFLNGYITLNLGNNKYEFVLENDTLVAASMKSGKIVVEEVLVGKN